MLRAYRHLCKHSILAEPMRLCHPLQTIVRIVRLNDLYLNRHFGFSQQLQSKFSITKSILFRMVTHYIWQVTGSRELLPENTSIIESFLDPPEEKHLISATVGYSSNTLDLLTIKTNRPGRASWVLTFRIESCKILCKIHNWAVFYQ